MDIDENDLLATNTFVPIPELKGEVSSENSYEFKRYYERERSLNEERRLRDSIDRMSIRSINLTEENDDSNLTNTNVFSKKIGTGSIKSGNVEQKRRTKEILTYVSIDSRNRDKVLYEKPSKFNIFLGKSFYNIKSIRLASIEFPNTNAVINTTNHAIYWTNQEDITLNKINAITETYPEYYVQLRTGSYISSSLQT
jgi:hypothetical protein